MLICIKDGSGSAINTSTYWTVVQSNVENLIIDGAGSTIFVPDNKFDDSQGSTPLSSLEMTNSTFCLRSGVQQELLIR